VGVVTLVLLIFTSRQQWESIQLWQQWLQAAGNISWPHWQDHGTEDGNFIL